MSLILEYSCCDIILSQENSGEDTKLAQLFIEKESQKKILQENLLDRAAPTGSIEFELPLGDPMEHHGNDGGQVPCCARKHIFSAI